MEPASHLTSIFSDDLLDWPSRFSPSLLGCSIQAFVVQIEDFSVEDPEAKKASNSV